MQNAWARLYNAVLNKSHTLIITIIRTQKQQEGYSQLFNWTEMFTSVCKILIKTIT